MSLKVAASLAALALASACHLDTGGEAPGWVYTEISEVPAACPPLSADVKALSKQRKITLEQAVDLSKKLHQMARAFDKATWLNEGRASLGMPPEPAPAKCEDSDSGATNGEKLLDEGSMATAQAYGD